MRVAALGEAGISSLIHEIVSVATVIDSKVGVNNRPVEFGFGRVSVKEIDVLGIPISRNLAIKRALDDLKLPPSYIILYDNEHEIDIQRFPSSRVSPVDMEFNIVKLSSDIACDIRDSEIKKICKDNPLQSTMYAWKTNNGYPTRVHHNALQLHGPSHFHRKSLLIP